MSVEVHVVTPEREVWSGEGEMLIARGIDGEVGILTGHAPLLIQLAIGPLRIQRESGEWLTAVVDGGFLHVSSENGITRADVLATSAELAGDIDVDAARRRVTELEQLLGQSGDTADGELGIEATKAELQKALARVTISA